MISRCDILAIISLPEYTFSPYAMEKTYAIVIQKLAPEEFNYDREITRSTFMYFSVCDGKANSKNRYRTNHISSSSVKMERAWNPKTYFRDPDWDQIRFLETWNGKGWDYKEGKKWGYFKLKRYQRVNKKKITCKSLKDKFEDYITGLDDEQIEELLTDTELFKNKVRQEYHLSATEDSKTDVIENVEFENGEICFSRYEKIRDLDLDIDSERYLGKKNEPVKMENITLILKNKKMTESEFLYIRQQRLDQHIM